MKKELTKLNCNDCTSLFITHDPKRRWGCNYFGFKSNFIPSIEVKKITGMECAYFNSKETRQHKAAVYTTLENMKDFEVVSWYSKSRDAGGKVRPFFTYGINSSLCRDFQVLLYIGKKARSKTFSACKFTFGTGFYFNYWDWPGAEKYLN